MDKKERRRLASKRYYERNKQKCYQASLKWKKNNPEKVKISQAKTDRRPCAMKTRLIRCWKNQGIIDGDYESLYNEFVNTKECMICGHDFSKYKKCLDHDHDTGEVRYICCDNCNNKFLSLRCNNFSLNVK